MRISELSGRSGASIPTIKFYVREGLLAPGRVTRGRHAEYDEDHVSRIHLIKTLTVMGRMTISAARDALRAIDERGIEVRGLCSVVNDALFGEPAATADLPLQGGVRQRIDAFIAQLGWQVDDESPSRVTLSQVFTALERLGGDGAHADVEALAPYALAAARLADLEQRALPRSVDSSQEAGRAVARAVLHEVALSVLRRMAREHLMASWDEGGSFGPVRPDDRQPSERLYSGA